MAIPIDESRRMPRVRGYVQRRDFCVLHTKIEARELGCWTCRWAGARRQSGPCGSGRRSASCPATTWPQPECSSRRVAGTLNATETPPLWRWKVNASRVLSVRLHRLVPRSAAGPLSSSSMSFFAILFALLIEQARPLAGSNPIHAGLRAWALSVSRNFDAGKSHHAWVAWCLAVLVPALVVLAMHWLLWWGLGWPFAVLWNVAVLYLTLGFRQFSHHFTGIRDALEEGDEDRARELLARWQQVDVGELPRSEVVRHVIEYSVLSAHRHVFGVLAWFSVFAALGLGPMGAVLYRMAEFVSRYWKARSGGSAQTASVALQRASMAAWTVIDWLPARLTALCFAVVGSFEEAIEGWRFHAQRFPNDNDGVVLAATAGAINVRLGGEALKARADLLAPQGFEVDADIGDSDSTPGREPEVAHLRSVVGLVWRSVVVWLLLLALLTLARLLG